MRSIAVSPFQGLSIALAIALTAGCATKKSPGTAEIVEQALPETTEIRPNWAADERAAPVDDGWLRSFQDRELQDLVDEALRNNLDLRVAATRVDTANAAITIARSQLLPAVGAGGQGVQTGGARDSRSSGAAVGVSWEVDVWGRIRSEVEAVEAQAAATEADYEFARQTVAARVAQGWFLATEAQRQLALAKENVDIQRRMVQMAEDRFSVGKVSRQDVLLAEADLAAGEDVVRKTQGAFEQAVRALELLLGRYPSAELEIRRTQTRVPPPTPAGLPSELLERRPDLVAAEQRVASSFQQVQAAKLAKLPRITLNASAGGASNELVNLLGAGSGYWQTGANFVAPIYTGGALESQVEIATAQQEAALASYGQAALRAFGDVETALSNERLLEEREQFLESAEDRNARAVDLARAQYEVGKVEMLSVLQMQTRLNQSRSAVIAIQGDRLVERVDLHLALGGSFSS